MATSTENNNDGQCHAARHRKSYDGTPITRHIDRISKTVSSSSSSARSGCKSTLLRLIAGLRTSLRDLLIGDQRVNDLPPKDRSVGMVFQSMRSTRA